MSTKARSDIHGALLASPAAEDLTNERRARRSARIEALCAAMDVVCVASPDYLSVIEGRCKTGSNGATWQTDAVATLEGRGLDRQSALAAMLELYAGHMHSNEPVHTWPLP